MVQLLRKLPVDELLAVGQALLPKLEDCDWTVWEVRLLLMCVVCRVCGLRCEDCDLTIWGSGFDVRCVRCAVRVEDCDWTVWEMRLLPVCVLSLITVSISICLCICLPFLSLSGLSTCVSVSHHLHQTIRAYLHCICECV